MWLDVSVREHYKFRILQNEKVPEITRLVTNYLWGSLIVFVILSDEVIIQIV